MAEEQKQIEEMTKAFCEVAHYDFCKDTACHACPIKRFAIKVYDKSYHKINENEVVISREEYEKLKLELAIEKKRADESYTQKEVEEIIASKERIKSKETTEEIITKIKQFLSNVETVLEDDKYSLYPEIGYKCSEVDDFIDELANNSMLVED